MVLQDILKVLIIIIFFKLGLNLSIETKGPHDIILLGSNGDLAKRYLWKVFYNLWDSGQYQLNLFAGSRKSGLDIKELLDYSIGTKRNVQFDNLVKPFVLTSQSDFNKLCNDHLNEDATFHIFYLAIPPYGFETAVKNIASECSNQVKLGKVKVILEKPFGDDFASANDMVSAISKHLPEQFLYRIDHYLGKQILRDVIDFRQRNPALESVLNGRHVERIDVVMQESIAVEGRGSYYDQYGVIRDIHQNHLTEMLLPVIVQLPQSTDHYSEEYSLQLSQNKVDILDKLKYVGSPLVAQYSTYSTEEPGRSNETHTFAAVLLKVNSPRWHNLPIVMMSGKKLKAKASYIRILFKDENFPPLLNDFKVHSPSSKKEIIFLLSSDSAEIKTGIICSDSLNCKMDQRSDYQKKSVQNQLHLLSNKASYYSVWFPLKENEAYYNLIEDAILSNRHHFISSTHLLSSWRLWTDILLLADIVPINYCATVDCYKFVTTQNGLLWQNKDDSLVYPHKKAYVEKYHLTRFNQDILVGPWASLMLILFNRIVMSANEAVEQRGVYHIALPGGSSVRLLYSLLSQSKRSLEEIPWNKTHVWLADERLVTPGNLAHSNIANVENQLVSHLIAHAGLSLTNVHYLRFPSSGDPHGYICDSYNQELNFHFLAHKNGGSVEYTFDEVVLGIGNDGHIASLFPQNLRSDTENENLAHCSTPPPYASWNRLTLSYKAIVNSRHFTLLLTDEKGKFSEKSSLALNLMSMTDYANFESKIEEPCDLPFCYLLFLSKSANSDKQNLFLIDKRLTTVF